MELEKLTFPLPSNFCSDHWQLSPIKNILFDDPAKCPDKGGKREQGTSRESGWRRLWTLLVITAGLLISSYAVDVAAAAVTPPAASQALGS